MFAMTRHDPFAARPMSDLLQMVRNDPFFAMSRVNDTEEGTLAVDVSEKDGQVVVRASLPGFNKEDIDIQVDNGVLSITAKHTEEHTDEHEKYYRRERVMQSVSRRIALPGIVSAKDAKADLKDGVLTLCLPQAEEARPKQIPVK